MQQQSIIPDDAPYSFKDQFRKLGHSLNYALSQWRILLFFGLLGLLLGGLYAWRKPVTYTSRMTFIVEESKASGGSLVSALAGQFGFDMSSLSGTSGILAGDNVLELVRSHSLIRNTLMKPMDGSGNSLADNYAMIYGWKEKWKESKKVGKQIQFGVGSKPLERLEDSLLQCIIKKITEEELFIAKPDRKLSFFQLSTTMRDEALSMEFGQRLLKETTDFYIETKTRRLNLNVQRLQAKADSLAVMLNRKTYSAADANRLLLDVNPIYANPGVSAEIASRDKFMQATIYGEIVKNLEISKTALIQETPTVQIVDEPHLPLQKNKTSLLLASLAGFVLLVFLSGIFLVVRRNF